MQNGNVNDRTVLESNALSLGWHIGYYQFVLAVAGKSDARKLRPDDEQVLRVIKSKINELAKFFNLDAEFLYPKSPAKARAGFSSIELVEESRSGSSFVDILATHHGKEAANLYTLGRTLMVYALIARRSEPEIQPEIARLKEGIRRDSQALRISGKLVEDLLSQPEELVTPAVLDRITDARRRVDEQRRAAESPKSPWATGSFYLAALLVVGILFLVMAKTVSAWVLPIVLIASMLAVSIIGALQLKNDARLSEKSFLALMGLAIKSLPLLRRGHTRDTNTNAPQ
jgi:hypothetical protein